MRGHYRCFDAGPKALFFFFGLDTVYDERKDLGGWVPRNRSDSFQANERDRNGIPPTAGPIKQITGLDN